LIAGDFMFLRTQRTLLLLALIWLLTFTLSPLGGIGAAGVMLLFFFLGCGVCLLATECKFAYISLHLLVNVLIGVILVAN
jgi:hypothetical protein